MVRLLLERGVDASLRWEGYLALVEESYLGHENVVRLLLEHGADASAFGRVGRRNTSALRAAGFRHVSRTKIIQFILEWGADEALGEERPAYDNSSHEEADR